MKKKGLLLFAAIAVIAACVFVWFVVLPNRPGVTKANFDRVKVGMNLTEVVEIFGEEPTYRQFNNRGIKVRVDIWQAADGSCAYVDSNHGRVVELGWVDSTETLWDKLRRWVSLK
jgi:hypothetical protein